MQNTEDVWVGGRFDGKIIAEASVPVESGRKLPRIVTNRLLVVQIKWGWVIGRDFP